MRSLAVVKTTIPAVSISFGIRVPRPTIRGITGNESPNRLLTSMSQGAHLKRRVMLIPVAGSARSGGQCGDDNVVDVRMCHAVRAAVVLEEGEPGQARGLQETERLVIR
jgi:hypothetical protein